MHSNLLFFPSFLPVLPLKSAVDLYHKFIQHLNNKSMKTFILAILTIMSVSANAGLSDKNVKQIGQLYTFSCDANGFNTHSLFYDDGKEVIAFDAQFTPELAKKAIAYLRTKTTNPIKWLVITHPNPDKFNGISAFKEIGATVVMSKETEKNLWAVHEYKKYYFVKMANMFTEESYPKVTA